MEMRSGSTNSSGISRHSSAAQTQDGPFPFLPPPAQVKANLERQAALSSSLSMPSQHVNFREYPVDCNQNCGVEIPDYPHPPWMDDVNQHEIYRNPRGFSMVHSDYDLPRGDRQFNNLGATSSITYASPSDNPEYVSNRKRKAETGRSKFKSFLGKFGGRRNQTANGPTTPLNDTESMLGTEPFPDFYSVGRVNVNTAYQTASGGYRTPAARTNTTSATQRYRRASWSSSARRVPRRSMFSTMKSRISAFLTNKPVKRGRTWEPSTRRSSNPFSPFTRRHAGHTGRTTESDMIGIQPVTTTTYMI